MPALADTDYERPGLTQVERNALGLDNGSTDDLLFRKGETEAPAITPLPYHNSGNGLSESEMREILRMAGFSGQHIEEALAISYGESGWQPEVVNGNTNTGDNSIGLFQINMLGQMGPARAKQLLQMGYGDGTVETAIELLKDPYINAQFAAQMSGNGTDWYHWGGYKGEDPLVSHGYYGGTSNGRAVTAGEEPGSSSYTNEDILTAFIQEYQKHFPVPGSQEVKDYAKANNISETEAYTGMLTEWGTSLATLVDLQRSMQLQASDLWQTPEGYVVPLKTLPPEMQQQIRDANEATRRKIFNDFALDQYSIASDRATSTFNAGISKFNSSLSLDNARIAQAQAAISRQLGGMEEARQRAAFVGDTLLKLAPWATAAGKTAFTPRDLGAIGIGFGKIAGIGPDEVAVRYPGTMTINPGAMLAGYDAQLGVGGPLADVPSLLTQQGDLPTLNLPPPPSLLSPGGPPSLLQSASPGVTFNWGSSSTPASVFSYDNLPTTYQGNFGDTPAFQSPGAWQKAKNQPPAGGVFNDFAQWSASHIPSWLR